MTPIRPSTVAADQARAAFFQQIRAARPVEPAPARPVAASPAPTPAPATEPAASPESLFRPGRLLDIRV